LSLDAEVAMRVLYERCAGFDRPKKTVVACVPTPAGARDAHL
jgi:hypothetical protein